MTKQTVKNALAEKIYKELDDAMSAIDDALWKLQMMCDGTHSTVDIREEIIRLRGKLT